MNAKTIKYIIPGIILLTIVLAFVRASYESSKPTTQEQCKNGSVDACLKVIEEAQTEYQKYEQIMTGLSQKAEEARKVITPQLSWKLM